MDVPLRPDGRAPDELRPVVLTRGYTKNAPGSVLVEFGDTVVLCTASVEASVPPWMRGRGSGWVTGEYSMLPGSTPGRSRRERNGPGGRTKEIERLIGRALRGVVDLKGFGERTVTVDCDCLQSDGGTRTAAITGGWVALHDAFASLVRSGVVAHHPVTQACAAVSVGIVDALAVLDLPYVEDSRADVDMNVVMTADGNFVEVQGTAEGVAFSRDDLNALLDLAEAGIRRLFEIQTAALTEG